MNQYVAFALPPCFSAGRGSEEAGMIKSVGSVLENNVVAHCLLGHLFNLQVGSVMAGEGDGGGTQRVAGIRSAAAALH